MLEHSTLVLNVTMLIDSISYLHYQASVRPMRLQQVFPSARFKIEGHVVDCWDARSVHVGNAGLSVVFHYA